MVECGAAINIENRAGLTPLTLAAYLARLILATYLRISTVSTQPDI